MNRASILASWAMSPSLISPNLSLLVYSKAPNITTIAGPNMATVRLSTMDARSLLLRRPRAAGAGAFAGPAAGGASGT